MTDHFVEVPKKVLSPASQAVLDAAFETDFDIDFANLDASIKATINNIAAAALRELADQLRLERSLGDTDADAGVFAAHHAIHQRLLAIAAELENAP